MVKKKLIEIVVCGVACGIFLGGKCVASEIEREQKINALKNIAASKKRKQKFNILKSIREIVESTLDQKLSEFSQNINVPQEKTELRKVMFKSAQDVRRYVKDKNNRIDEKNLDACINETINYFQEDARILRGLPPEWRDAKIVEILSEIVEIKGLNLMDLMGKCYDEIRTRCNNSKFTRARLLLISQCKTWDEEREEFELQTDRDKEVVRNAISLLYFVSQKKNNDPEMEKAEQFLELIKSNKEIVLYFPEKYFDEN
jgi:hypothetical protein